MYSRKIIHILLFLSTITLTISFFVPQCLAMNTGFEVEDIDSSLIESATNNLEIMPLENHPDIKQGFSCYDVNDAGNIVLGFDVGRTDIILAYDVNAKFLFGFSMKDNGAFGLKWDGDDILVFRVRSDLAVRLSNSGECKEIKQISDTLHNQNYWRDEIYASKRICGDNVFIAEHKGIANDLFHWGTYTTLSKVSPAGEQTALFDYSSDASGTSIIAFLSFSIIIVISFAIILYRKNSC